MKTLITKKQYLPSTNFNSIKSGNGFSLVEILLALSFFSLISVTLAGAIIYGQQTALLAGQRTRAVLLVEEGLEAVRNIRDNNFNNLQDGTFGLSSNSGVWELFPGSDSAVTFSRQVTISSFDSDAKNVSVQVSWSQNGQNNRVVSAAVRLTNWRAD